VERSVTPLPPAIGQTIFVGIVVGLVWFFLAGDHVFGPLATRKVKLLQQSAQRNDVAGIARAIQEGVFIDCRDGQGMTALMLAVRAGAVPAVDALIEAGANPNLRTSADETALLMAIHTNHLELVGRLLQGAPDVSIADSNGRNALHAAAERGDVATLRLILKAGRADSINLADNHGWTPLFFAVASGQEDAVQLLLAAGADAQQKLPDGRTAADLGKSVHGMGEAGRKTGP
jgi:ankyrin repeat protein